MSSDREMLELAAKASWITIGGWNGEREAFSVPGDGLFWNPLTDDGDALRLAVKLKLNIEPRSTCVFAFGRGRIVEEPFDAPGCDAEATRRAVVRVAAEIGRQTEGGAA